jgi:hypothetical protein
LDTATVGLNVTITSQVVVYASDEKAEKLLLFLLYPYLICGVDKADRAHSPIFKLLRSLRIDSKKPIPTGCGAWRAGTKTLFLLGPIDCLKIRAQAGEKCGCVIVSSKACPEYSVLYTF